MNKDMEFDRLMKKAELLIARYNELSKKEMGELNTVLAAAMKISNERTDEMIAQMKENDIIYDKAANEMNELRNSITIMEAFILERGLKDDLMAYTEEILQEFRPNLTLIQ